MSAREYYSDQFAFLLYSEMYYYVFKNTQEYTTKYTKNTENDTKVSVFR